MVVLGFITTYLVNFALFKRYFQGDYPLERAVSCWGTSTGVFLTGIMLLRVTDPEFKLPVMNDYSIAFALFPLFGFVLTPITVELLLHSPFALNFTLQSALVVACLLLLLCADRIAKGLQRSG
jgi:ESS family glutamate:Na+ symporter